MVIGGHTIPTEREVVVEVDFRWTEPDIDGLVEFMCKKNGFDEKRILSGAEKLKKARTGKQQGRLDSFFSVLPSSGPKVGRCGVLARR